jgi:hypothetical protein
MQLQPDHLTLQVVQVANSARPDWGEMVWTSTSATRLAWDENALAD